MPRSCHPPNLTSGLPLLTVRVNDKEIKRKRTRGHSKDPRYSVIIAPHPTLTCDQAHARDTVRQQLQQEEDPCPAEKMSGERAERGGLGARRPQYKRTRALGHRPGPPAAQLWVGAYDTPDAPPAVLSLVLPFLLLSQHSPGAPCMGQSQPRDGEGPGGRTAPPCLREVPSKAEEPSHAETSRANVEWPGPPPGGGTQSEGAHSKEAAGAKAL